MRKIILTFAVLLFSISVLATWVYASRMYTTYTENYASTKEKFEKSSNNIITMLDRMGQRQNAFAKNGRFDNKSLTQFLLTEMEVHRVVYHDKDGAVIKGFQQLSDGSVIPDNFFDLDILAFIKKGTFGWIDCFYSLNREVINFIYLTPIRASNSEEITGYLVAFYKSPTVIENLSNLLFTNLTFACLLDGEGNTIIHPFYKPHMKPKFITLNFPFQKLQYFSQKINQSNDWTLYMQIDLFYLLAFKFESFTTPLLLLISWGAFFVLLFVLLSNVLLGETKSLWKLSFWITTLISLFIAYDFFCFVNFPPISTPPISFLTTFSEMAQGSLDNVIEVPTSIQISAIRFPDNDSFEVDGLITQSYPLDLEEQIGFIFPLQSSGESSSTIKEIFRIRREGRDYILSQFNVIFRSDFSQELFPFDRRNLKILIWPLTGKYEIRFIPDSNVYDAFAPEDLPGISTITNIPNWQLIESRFTFEEVPRFFFRDVDKKILPKYALSYVILAERSLINAFAGNFVPLIISQIFSLILLITPVSKFKDPTLSALAILLAIIFVVVLNQTDVRKNIGIDSFAYIEYMYVLFYIQMVLLSINILMLTAFNKNFFIIGYRDNLVPKLVYFPVVSLSFFLIMTFSLFA